MTDWTAIRERYLRESLPTRLGGLAANLGRIRSFAARGSSADVVASLIEESKRLIEWTAEEADIQTGAELVELQVELARWQQRWERGNAPPDDRMHLSRAAGMWAQRVLEMSGLLP
ncbi:MAG TPA: hypothetical protein VJK02_22885 [Anaerolineales bacterium]|nr:hypothetical protein [Anaerolineales bacterium]